MSESWWQAVTAKDYDRVSELLASNPKLAEEVDARGTHSIWGHPECEDGREVGQTALHHAANDLDCPEHLMRELVAAWPGAAAHTSKCTGWVPLHHAGYGILTPNLVRILLEANPAAVHLKDADGNTPLEIYRARHGIVEIMRGGEGGVPESSVALLEAAMEEAAPAATEEDAPAPAAAAAPVGDGNESSTLAPAQPESPVSKRPRLDGNTALMNAASNGPSINPPIGLGTNPRTQSPVPAAASAPAAGAPSVADELGKLFDLKEKGAISQDEFDAVKANLLRKYLLRE